MTLRTASGHQRVGRALVFAQDVDEHFAWIVAGRRMERHGEDEVGMPRTAVDADVRRVLASQSAPIERIAERCRHEHAEPSDGVYGLTKDRFDDGVVRCAPHRCGKLAWAASMLKRGVPKP